MLAAPLILFMKINQVIKNHGKSEAMRNVHINAGNGGKGYDVVIGSGLLSESGERIRKILRADKVAMFTDSSVNIIYGDKIEKQLADAGFETCRYVFPAGEGSKDFGTVASFIDFMAEQHMSRRDAVVALGGGVAGDMGGFAASIYLRGIEFIQIPTSLLAAVDSSVGGKTGVDIAAGKNLVGAFWQPSLVLCDTDTFETLGNDQILDGTAEILKTGAIRDAELFRRAAEGDIISMAEEIVEICVRIKGEVVDADEKEAGLRKILNFGHTMAHAIEKYSDFGISHGKAVAVGMLMITKAFERMGMTASGTYDMLLNVISEKGFETEYDAPLDELCNLAASDKKAGGGHISLVYIPEIGRADTFDVSLEKLYDIMR